MQGQFARRATFRPWFGVLNPGAASPRRASSATTVRVIAPQAALGPVLRGAGLGPVSVMRSRGLPERTDLGRAVGATDLRTPRILTQIARRRSGRCSNVSERERPSNNADMGGGQPGIVGRRSTAAH